MPAGLARQHRKVPRRLTHGQGIAAAGGEDAGTVGCHPSELLVVELDQHPRGQRVDPRQQRVALPGVPAVGRQHVAGGDQPGQGHRQPPVPAVTEVSQGTVQPGAHSARRHPRRRRREAKHRVPDLADQQFPDLSAASGRDRGNRSSGPAARRGGRCRAQRCQELPSAHVVVPSPRLTGNPRRHQPRRHATRHSRQGTARAPPGPVTASRLVRRDRKRTREPAQHRHIRQRRHAPLIPRHLRRGVPRPVPQLRQRQPAPDPCRPDNLPGRRPPAPASRPRTPPTVTSRTPSVTCMPAVGQVPSGSGSLTLSGTQEPALGRRTAPIRNYRACR